MVYMDLFLVYPQLEKNYIISQIKNVLDKYFMPTDSRIKKMKEVLRNRQLDLTVVCENIHDPHNVSAILRSCDAVGITNIHLIYTIESFPALGKKSSASAKKWIEIISHRDYIELIGYRSNTNEATQSAFRQNFAFSAPCSLSFRAI